MVQYDTVTIRLSSRVCNSLSYEHTGWRKNWATGHCKLRKWHFTLVRNFANCWQTF